MTTTTRAPASDAPPRGRPRIDSGWLRRNGVYVALALLVLVNVAITPNFVSATNLRLQLVQVSPVLIVALGMAMVIGREASTCPWAPSWPSLRPSSRCTSATGRCRRSSSPARRGSSRAPWAGR
jgi:hypothetical protein